MEKTTLTEWQITHTLVGCGVEEITETGKYAFYPIEEYENIAVTIPIVIHINYIQDKSESELINRMKEIFNFFKNKLMEINNGGFNYDSIFHTVRLAKNDFEALVEILPLFKLENPFDDIEISHIEVEMNEIAIILNFPKKSPSEMIAFFGEKIEIHGEYR